MYEASGLRSVASLSPPYVFLSAPPPQLLNVGVVRDQSQLRYQNSRRDTAHYIWSANNHNELTELTRRTCVWEVTGSSLSRGNRYPVWDISWFSTDLQSACSDRNFKYATTAVSSPPTPSFYYRP
jgi:hypothetical protein